MLTGPSSFLALATRSACDNRALCLAASAAACSAALRPLPLPALQMLFRSPDIDQTDTLEEALQSGVGSTPIDISVKHGSSKRALFKPMDGQQCQLEVESVSSITPFSKSFSVATWSFLAPSQAARHSCGASIGIHAALAALIARLGHHRSILGRRPGRRCVAGLPPPAQHAAVRPRSCSLASQMRITDPRRWHNRSFIAGQANIRH